MATDREMDCIVDSAFGIYVPQMFVQRYEPDEWGVRKVDAEELQNPDNEFYWETWEEVLSTAKFTDDRGHVWRLLQDGDLFAVDCGKEGDHG